MSKKNQNYHNNIIKKLRKSIEAFDKGNVKKEKNASIFIINILNIENIKIIYGNDFAEINIIDLLTHLKKTFLPDLIERISYQELCLYYHKINEEQAKVISNKILSYITSYQNHKAQTHLIATIGSSTFEHNKQDIDNQVEKAYIALKSTNPELQIYHLSYNEYYQNISKQKEEYTRAAQIKKTILEHNIELLYQPIVNGSNFKVEYYECLTRIFYEKNAPRSIGNDIILAEKFNFIILLDIIVLDLVYKALKENLQLKLSFNISAINLNNEALLDKAIIYFSDKQIAKRVQIEITETIMNKDLNQFKSFIKIMRNMGCKIALDDFGVGNTSFSQLFNLEIDTVKIDGSFAKNLLSNHNSELFISTLTKMKSVTNFSIVVEYVENEEIAKLLQKMGVEYMQGYYFGSGSIDRP